MPVWKTTNLVTCSRSIWVRHVWVDLVGLADPLPATAKAFWAVPQLFTFCSLQVVGVFTHRALEPDMAIIAIGQALMGQPILVGFFCHPIKDIARVPLVKLEDLTRAVAISDGLKEGSAALVESDSPETDLRTGPISTKGDEIVKANQALNPAYRDMVKSICIGIKPHHNIAVWKCGCSMFWNKQLPTKSHCLKTISVSMTQEISVVSLDPLVVRLTTVALFAVFVLVDELLYPITHPEGAFGDLAWLARLKFDRFLGVDDKFVNVRPVEIK